MVLNKQFWKEGRKGAREEGYGFLGKTSLKRRGLCSVLKVICGSSGEKGVKGARESYKLMEEQSHGARGSRTDLRPAGTWVLIMLGVSVEGWLDPPTVRFQMSLCGVSMGSHLCVLSGWERWFNESIQIFVVQSTEEQSREGKAGGKKEQVKTRQTFLQNKKPLNVK